MPDMNPPCTGIIRRLPNRPKKHAVVSREADQVLDLHSLVAESEGDVYTRSDRLVEPLQVWTNTPKSTSHDPELNSL